MKTKISDPTQDNAGKHQPYPPSFIDRFMHLVKRLPIPYWATYFLLFLLQVIIFHVLSWLDGWIPPYTFNAMILIFPIWQWGTLMIMTYLNGVALGALSSFSPLLKIDEENLKRLQYEFRTMPSGKVILSGVIWAIIYSVMTLLAINAVYASLGLGNTFKTAVIIEGLICFCTGSVIYYHTIRLLLLVRRTVGLVEHFNLFRLEPVYAFSRLTSQIGITWMLLLSLTLLTFPLKMANVLALAMLGIQILMAIAAFILPLWAVHRRLLLEKRTLIAGYQRIVEATLERFHHALDKNIIDEASKYNNIMLGLKAEREVLTAIPTWPWRESTLTGFLSAIGLPIILLLIQIAIKKWLGV